MGKLTGTERKHLPASTFAGPDRSYPIPDKKHAAVAKAYAERYASPAVKAEVDAKANRMLHEPKGAPMGKHHSAHGFRTHSREGQ